ncbi:MAG: HAD family hydrolase [Caldilineaceae bacterium]|nr:HAD family hydrolase [Caldilineaceae bacterium]
MSRQIEAVLFDMDETLLDRQASLRAFVRAQHARHAHVLGSVDVEHFVERFLTLDDNGRLWKDEVYRRILDENDITDLDAQTLVDEYLADFNRHCIGFPDLRPMLDALQPLGLRLGVITNGRYPFQQRNFEALSVADFFDIVVVSGAEQIRKPDPEIFHRALGRIGASPKSTVFVGDNPDADIRGAQNVGMRGVWKRNFYWPTCPHADAVIDNLRDLPPLLHTWQNG